MFGYPYADLSPDHAKWLLNKKTELKKQLAGTAYFNSILDKINTESSVANRAMMPDYLDPKRFPWVFFADSFMWPFNNEHETARNPDEGVYIPLQEKVLRRYMQQAVSGQLTPQAAFDRASQEIRAQFATPAEYQAAAAAAARVLADATGAH